jgi:hypothetical protein
MMTRKRWVLLLALVILGCVGVAGSSRYLEMMRPSAINETNVARIQNGMTLAQVEAILGGPPRIEAIWPIIQEFATVKDFDDHMRVKERIGGAASVWQSHHAMIWVEFDADERVIDSTWTPALYSPLTTHLWLRNLFGL